MHKNFQYLILLFVLAVMQIGSVSANEANIDATEPLECFTGPVKRNYGNTEWNVYICSDDQSLMLVSVLSRPGQPYMLTFAPCNGIYAVAGEGLEDKAMNAAVTDELQNLSDSEIMELIAAIKAVPPAKW